MADTNPAGPNLADSKNNKLQWGPILWQIFHLLAEISDKPEVLPLWKNWFAQTSRIMPCEKCRQHLQQYLRANAFIRAKSAYKKGEPVRAHVRQELLQLHNHVNQNTGKPAFTTEQYTEKYGQKQKPEILLETKNCLQELEKIWLPLDFFKLRKREFATWKRSFVMLYALLQ